MNTSAKSVVEVVSFSEPPPSQPPGYKVCLYRTATNVGEDTFVGKIAGMRFDGNHLTLWLSPFTRALRLDRADDLTERWECLAPVISIKLEFDGCRMIAKESNAEKATYKSNTDDIIVLSNGSQDIREAEELFSPASA